MDALSFNSPSPLLHQDNIATQHFHLEKTVILKLDRMLVSFSFLNTYPDIEIKKMKSLSFLLDMVIVIYH